MAAPFISVGGPRPAAASEGCWTAPRHPLSGRDTDLAGPAPLTRALLVHLPRRPEARRALETKKPHCLGGFPLPQELRAQSPQVAGLGWRRFVGCREPQRLASARPQTRGDTRRKQSAVPASSRSLLKLRTRLCFAGAKRAEIIHSASSLRTKPPARTLNAPNTLLPRHLQAGTPGRSLWTAAGYAQAAPQAAWSRVVP